LRIFYKTLKIFSDFSRENHGHGGHEHGVRWGVFGGKLSLKNKSAGGRLCTLPENPHFWVPAAIKVRPPDGMLLTRYSQVIVFNVAVRRHEAFAFAVPVYTRAVAVLYLDHG
jgi:hypothetical protein